MPIEPIRIFQDNGSGNVLANLFQGGQGVLTNILNSAVQIGRDISNKQLAQEQDLLGMRRQEQALAQRRGENLQQDWEDVFRFGENVRQFDTKFNRSVLEGDRAYAANREDAAWRQQAEADRNALAEARFNKTYDLSQERLGLERDKIAAVKDATAQKREDLLNFAKSPVADPTVKETVIGDPLRITSTDEPSDFGSKPPMPSDLLTQPTKREAVTPTREDLAAAQAELLGRASAAEDAGDPALATQLRARAARFKTEDQPLKLQEGIDIRQSNAVTKPVTHAEVRAQYKAELADIKSRVEGNTQAFPLHATAVGRRINAENAKDSPDENVLASLKSELEVAKKRDAASAEAEMAAIRDAKTEDEYVKMYSSDPSVKITKEVEKARRELYKKVKALDGDSAPPAESNPAKTLESEYID